IGFRAPAWQELATQFLAYLQEHVEREGRYRDPQLRPTGNPGRLGGELLRQACRQLDRIRWSRADVTRFMGCYLTEPKPHVFFTPPPAPLQRAAFVRQACRKGVALDPKSRMLYNGAEIFLNGEHEAMEPALARHLRTLADIGSMQPTSSLESALLERLYAWYRAGFLHLCPERT
ncbi:MAG: cupin domain-containing protein, partial [Burkholderiales bacterium]|nr:cupin domain-containing protein [Burkholderiales bacterium]